MFQRYTWIALEKGYLLLAKKMLQLFTVKKTELFYVALRLAPSYVISKAIDSSCILISFLSSRRISGPPCRYGIYRFLMEKGALSLMLIRDYAPLFTSFGPSHAKH